MTETALAVSSIYVRCRHLVWAVFHVSEVPADRRRLFRRAVHGELGEESRRERSRHSRTQVRRRERVTAPHSPLARRRGAQNHSYLSRVRSGRWSVARPCGAGATFTFAIVKFLSKVAPEILSSPPGELFSKSRLRHALTHLSDLSFRHYESDPGTRLTVRGCVVQERECASRWTRNPSVSSASRVVEREM